MMIKNKGTKRALLAAFLAVLLCAAGCGESLPKFTPVEDGFLDEEHDIRYISCNRLALRPLEVGKEYATDGTDTYYTVPFEDPKRFICDNHNGISYLFRAADVEEPTIETFHPIAADIYLEGEASVYVGSLYCEKKYLDEELQGESNRDDSDLVYAIRDALIKDEHVEVPPDKFSGEDMFFIRLLSADYPGLYYTTVFYTDTDGVAYLMDRGSMKTVLCPQIVTARMIGGS